MDFTKLMSAIFGVIFVVILYSIIYYALKIMYKDVKGGNRRRKKSSSKKAYGIEIVSSTNQRHLKVGAIIPVNDTLTLGRRDNNSLVLEDQFVSSYHAKMYLKNNEFFIEDLESTNGTFVNNSKIKGKIKLKVNDKIRLGSTIFKVIG